MGFEIYTERTLTITPDIYMTVEQDERVRMAGIKRTDTGLIQTMLFSCENREHMRTVFDAEVEGASNITVVEARVDGETVLALERC